VSGLGLVFSFSDPEEEEESDSSSESAWNANLLAGGLFRVDAVGLMGLTCLVSLSDSDSSSDSELCCLASFGVLDLIRVSFDLSSASNSDLSLDYNFTLAGCFFLSKCEKSTIFSFIISYAIWCNSTFALSSIK